MEKSLKQTFFECLDTYNALEKTNEPINSNDIQLKIKEAMKLFEKCTEQVSDLAIFSDNEDIEEVATGDLPFLLLPALLGCLTLKLCSNDRKSVVEAAEVYFKDFLIRCSRYGLVDYDESKKRIENTNRSRRKDDFVEMIRTRMTKIARFKDKKELQNNVASLKSIMDTPEGCQDESLERKYYLGMIQTFIYQGVEELESIDAEKPLIEYRRVELEEARDSKASIAPKSKPLNVVIIAKNQAQKLVFGAGYPSLPVMSVEEFYDKRVRDGIFPVPNSCQVSSSMANKMAGSTSLTEEEENEAKLEVDDADMLERMRQRDDYKDDHRRGWGNRYNRS